MKFILIILVFSWFTCHPIFSQVSEQGDHDTFVLFLSPYTSQSMIDNVADVMEKSDINITFSDIRFAEDGTLLNLFCESKNVCKREDYNISSPVNFDGFRDNLVVVFISPNCDSGVFQVAYDEPNTVMSLFFSNGNSPTYTWNIIGDHPRLSIEDFEKHHVVWE